MISLSCERTIARSVYGHVIAKFSRMGRLLHFLTHGALLARFAREISAINSLFCHAAFPPGPYIFTKVLRPLVRYWRLQKAIRIAVYLDDGLGVCPTFPDCYSQSMAVKSDLSQAGFQWDSKHNFFIYSCGKIDRL